MMFGFFGVLAVITAGLVWLAERRDAPLRRNDRSGTTPAMLQPAE